MKNKKIFYVSLLSLIFISFSASAKPRTDFWTDSGAYYDFYLDWMYPKRNVGPVPPPTNIKPLTVKVTPRTDFYTDSGAYYDFYLDWMYPKGKNRPANIATKTLTAKANPRTDFDGPGDSGAYYDFYLDWMSPRVKNTRVIKFFTRDKGTFNKDL